MKYITALLTLMLFNPVNSQYLNLIINESEEGLYHSSAVLTDTNLIYQTKKNNEFSLWSMNLETKNKKKLITSPDNYSPIKHIEKFNDKLYFAFKDENRNYLLWQTDGTRIGTQKINITRLNSEGYFGIFNGFLFAENIDQKLLQLKNNEFIMHDIKFPSLNYICAFEENNFIVQSRNAAADTFKLHRVEAGTVTEIYSYSSTYDDDAGFTYLNDSCFFKHSDQGEKQYLYIPKNGAPRDFADFNSNDEIDQLFTHQNRLYAIVGNNNANSIHRLSPDLSRFDASTFVLEYIDLSHPSSENHLISAAAKDQLNGGRSTFIYFDSDLNIINSYYSYSRNINDYTHVTSSEVLVGFNDSEVGAVIQSINAQNQVSLTAIKDRSFGGVISNDESDQFYLMLGDPQLRYANIYSLSDQPAINEAINGVWHEFDLFNQGLVVQKGQRHDGSEYAFATLYAFDQGKPLWLAGTSALKLNQKKLDFTLYQYDGIGLFEYDVSPDREVFGQLSLEFINCDSITATISTAIYNQSLPLYRIDDTSYKHLCADVSSLDLDTLNKSNAHMEMHND